MRIYFILLPLLFCLCAMGCQDRSSSKSISKKKGDPNKRVRVVLMLGGEEMVGRARVMSASYLLGPSVMPPKEVTVTAHEGMPHQINGAYLYWQALSAYGGPAEKKQELKRLVKERMTFREKFKQQVLDELEKNDGMFRGKKYAKRRGFWLFNMQDLEAEAAGITPKIREILEGPDNRFGVEEAYRVLEAGSKVRESRNLQLKRLLMKGASPESFDHFAKELELWREGLREGIAPAEQRMILAKKAEEILGLPISERTHIVSLGSVQGEERAAGTQISKGPLSIGYGNYNDQIGLEYAAGLALEGEIDAPLLVIKCSWMSSNRGVGKDWVRSSVEGELTAWDQLSSLLGEVMSKPGAFHPEYDANHGLEFSGVIWMQGSQQRQQVDAGDQLEGLLKRLRSHVQNPELPMVCGTVGNVVFSQESESFPANVSLRALAKRDQWVRVVDCQSHYPAELQMLSSLFFKRKLRDGDLEKALHAAATVRGKRSPAYMGSASFFLSAGDEMGTELAKLMGE